MVNLAAQAGVRYSITNPSAYVKTNLVRFSNILECSRNYKIKHFVYASSSSVWGNTSMPFEKQPVDHPVSLYAATKKLNELMAHSYSHLQSSATGLRFLDLGAGQMALFLFTKSILGKPSVFNHGQMIRDFTYIDDITESLRRIINKPATSDDLFDTYNPNPSSSWAPHRIYNIGNSSPTKLMDYINAIEKCIGVVAKKEFLPLQMGDVPSTSSNCCELESWIGFKPKTSVYDGVKSLEWYRYFMKFDKKLLLILINL